MRPHTEVFFHRIVRARYLNTIYVLFSASVLGAYLHYALTNSWFIGQDFDHLILLQKETFALFLKTPIDIHFPLPLHRFFCWLFYKALRMNFFAAISFLGIIFVWSSIYLYKLLQLIQPSRLNPALITLYTSNIYLLDLFIWWSSGLHRFPYLLSAIACCYHGLSFQKNLQKHDALLCILFFILAFGFFEKAILIPTYVLVVIISTSLTTKESIKGRSMLLIAAMALISAIYAAALIFSSNANHSVTKKPEIFFATLQIGVKKSLQCLLPIPYNPFVFPNIISFYPYLINLAICLIAYAALKKNTAAIKICFLFFILLSLNFFPIAASNRAEQFTPFFVLLTRYYFENVFLFLIFLAFIYKSFKRKEIKLQKSQWTDIRPLFTLAIATINILIAYKSAVSTAQKEYQALGGHRAASYARQLEKNLNSPENRNVTILDQPLPSFIYDPSAGTPPLLSNLAVAWQLPVKFGDRTVAEFYVDDTGNLQKTRQPSIR